MPRTEGTKTQAIREVMKGGKPMLFDEILDKLENKLQQVIGKQWLYQQLATMANVGHIFITGRADERRYQLVKK